MLPLRESLLGMAGKPDPNVLLWRIQLLGAADRAMMEALALRGVSSVALGRLLGVEPSTVRRRARRLTGLITSRWFLDVCAALPRLAPTDAMIARMRFCQGLSCRQIAKRLRICDATALRWLDRVKARIETIRDERKASNRANAPQPLALLPTRECLQEQVA